MSGRIVTVVGYALRLGLLGALVGGSLLASSQVNHPI
jgi:hypothetical protein